MSAQKPVAKPKVSKNRSSVAARMEKQQQQRQMHSYKSSGIQEMNYSLLLPFPPLLAAAPTTSNANIELEQMLKNVGASLTATTSQPFGNGPARNSVRGKANQKVNQLQLAVGGKSGSPTKAIKMEKPAAISSMPNYFGVNIPELIMDDLLFRFIYNIPENEKTSQIRVCFQIEQAHWFYVDFYCSSQDYPECRSVGFKEFVRQVFHKCDYLQKWKGNVDSIIEEFRFYKSNVPTYGLVLLDSTLNYVLLVQGYFASKNNWGFPKGKVNEEEMPMQCALREVLEEVNYDATDRIVSGKRPLQCFLNDTLIQLYVATDVPMDHNFQPHLRKEIRKISWFSVWDLPKDRFDEKTCSKLGLTPNNFYTVIPFVNDIRNFIRKEQVKRQKLQPKITILRKDSSAFEPVIPRANSLQNHLNCISPPVDVMGNLDSPSCSSTVQLPDQENSGMGSATTESLFKPVIFDATTACQPASFTGTAFMEKFMQTTGLLQTSTSSKAERSDCVSTPKTHHPAPIGSESKSRRKEIKQPKPVHSSLIINVYQASSDTPPSSPKINKTKNYGPFFDHPSTSTDSPSMQQQQQAQPTPNKNVIGAVGQLVNESQRSKLRQSHEKQQEQQQQPTSLQSHNLGISVDLVQLFNSAKITVGEKKTTEEPKTNQFDSPVTALAGIDFSTPPPELSRGLLKREDGKMPNSLPSASSFPAQSNIRKTPVFERRREKNQAKRQQQKLALNTQERNALKQLSSISIAEQSSSTIQLVKPLALAPGPYRQTSQPDPLVGIKLCKAWQEFKIDRLRLVLPF